MCVKVTSVLIQCSWKTCPVVHQLSEAVTDSLPRLCFISDNSCWCSHWSFSISILNLRICGKHTQRLKCAKYYYDTLNKHQSNICLQKKLGIILYGRIYLCNCVSWCALGKIVVDFSHCPFNCVHNLQSFGKKHFILESTVLTIFIL